MTPLQKEIIAMFPPGNPNIRMISKIGESPQTDKMIRQKSPTPKKAEKQIVKGTFWYAFHYHVWPRLFCDNKEKQAAALDWLQRQKKYWEKRDMIYPPKPIFQ